MIENQSIWTILQTYSFVQGFLLAGYALIALRRPYLSALLTAISLLIVAHLYYHFEWYIIEPHFIFSEAPLWYLIGPFFYFFVLKLFQRSFKWYHSLHLIPFIGFLVFVVPFYGEQGDDKIKILNSIFGEETYRVDINRVVFSAHILLYIIISYLTFNKESKRLMESSSQSTLILDTIISLTLRYYLIFSFFAFVIYLVVGSKYEWSDWYYEIYYLGLSFLIHFIFYYSLIRTEEVASAVDDNQRGDVHEHEAQKYVSSSLSGIELQEITDKVIAYVSQFEVYKNPELRLRMIADELDIPAHHISQAVNQKLQKSFFDLINEQRINGIRMNIHDPKFKNYTLVGIASEHGFKSSSSFYRIFKKYTGKTPKEFFNEVESIPI